VANSRANVASSPLVVGHRVGGQVGEAPAFQPPVELLGEGYAAVGWRGTIVDALLFLTQATGHVGSGTAVDELQLAFAVGSVSDVDARLPGDRIVTLAPAARGQVVTSERGVVTAVDLEHVRIAVEMEDGRRYWFEQEVIGASQLAHGYATTVHRSQGATHDIAHVYEDGGGRGLAYVAMSRAREQTNVYLGADDLDQAREDLCRSWETERCWKWAIDTGSVGSDTPGTPAERIASLRQQALQAERDALAAAIPKTLISQLRQAESDLKAATRNLEWLREERGLRSDGELGRAAAELLSARRQAFQNQLTAENKDRPRGVRRTARRHAPAHNERVQVAEARLEQLFLPEEQKLTEALDQPTQKVEEISHEVSDRERWMDDHFHAPAHLAELGAKLREVKHENDHERWTVEGELNPRPEPVRVAAFSWERNDSRSIANDRDYGFGMCGHASVNAGLDPLSTLEDLPLIRIRITIDTSGIYPL